MIRSIIHLNVISGLKSQSLTLSPSASPPFLTNYQAPNYHYRLLMICLMIQPFNDHVYSHLDPILIVCLDESMVAFLNKHCPYWINVKKNPHGNEYHMIFFALKLFEAAKDQPKKGPFSANKFEGEMAKTALLCCWLTEFIQGSG